VREVATEADLARGVALEREQQLVASMPAHRRDADQPLAGALEFTPSSRPAVDGVPISS